MSATVKSKRTSLTYLVTADGLCKKASVLLSLDGVVVLGNLVATSLDLLLGGLALLSRSFPVFVIVGVLDGGLLSALLGSSLVLGLGSGERGVCSVGKITVSNSQSLSWHALGTALTSALALSASRSHGGELLLDNTPGVGSGFDSVEVRGDSELFEVDLRRGLEAVPGGLQDALLLLGEDGLVGLGRGGLLGGRGGHGGECKDVGCLGAQ